MSEEEMRQTWRHSQMQKELGAPPPAAAVEAAPPPSLLRHPGGAPAGPKSSFPLGMRSSLVPVGQNVGRRYGQQLGGKGAHRDMTFTKGFAADAFFYYY